MTARMNGSLFATSNSMDAKEQFTMTVVNRPILVLRGQYGFVAFKTSGSSRVECNKASYDIIKMEYTGNGTYFLKGKNSMRVNMYYQQVVHTDLVVESNRLNGKPSIA